MEFEDGASRVSQRSLTPAEGDDGAGGAAFENRKKMLHLRLASSSMAGAGSSHDSVAALPRAAARRSPRVGGAPRSRSAAPAAASTPAGEPSGEALRAASPPGGGSGARSRSQPPESAGTQADLDAAVDAAVRLKVRAPSGAPTTAVARSSRSLRDLSDRRRGSFRSPRS